MKLMTSSTTAPPGYSPSIHLLGHESSHDPELVKFLDQLCCWGGNTSNNPQEYSRWEIPANKIGFGVVACINAGYTKVKWFTKTAEGIVYCDLHEKVHRLKGAEMQGMQS